MHIVIDGRIRQSSTGRYVDALIRHLQSIDRKNTYTILLHPDDAWRPIAQNFKALPCPYSQFSLNPFEQIGFARLLRGLKPSLVHFTMPQQPLFYFGKTVTTVHDLTIVRFPRPKAENRIIYSVKDFLYRCSLSHVLRKTQTILVPTRYVAHDLSKYLPVVQKKVTVTYEASEPPIQAKARKPSLVNTPFILHVGSPLPHKNIDRLVKAFEVLYAKNPDLHLVLAGKKEFYFEQLRAKIAASPARDNVHITGFVDDAELKWLYENAECYVLPSLSEGFGLPGLEAMAHDCAVASSNATCLPEVYRDAALYFDPLNPTDMADKIQSLLGDKQLRRRLIKEGHARLKDFSWKRMAEQTLAVYKSAAKK